MISRQEKHTRELSQRLAESEATTDALISGQIDGIVASNSTGLVLLAKAQEALRQSEESLHRERNRELLQSEQRYRLLFRDSPTPMVVYDPETLAFLAVNTAAEDLYGYPREQLLRMTLRDNRPPEEDSALASFLKTAKGGSESAKTVVIQNKDKKLISIESHVRTVDFDGRKACLSQMIDVTEREHLETLLRQSQKMEAIGRLAGGMAHDFNNLLTVILGHSDRILHHLDGADPVREKVLEIQAAGRRAANLTSQLLAFSRKQMLVPQILELNTIVSSICQMLQQLLGEDIEISLRLDQGLGRVEADPTQLELVLVNLAVNARDAMPNGGHLTIQTLNRDLDQQTASVVGLQPGKYALLEVSDTGSGIDEATQARVFEPFFTTKEVGKGTGLGLSMVFGVVQQSGGTVTLCSEIGVGTTFRIYLPCRDVPATEPVEPKEPRGITNAVSATILLVEDEPSLRALAGEILREAGYRVFESSNGKQAVQLSGTLSRQPDLLLTDMVMPEMSGLELAKELRKKWPGLSVMFTSGYTDHELLECTALGQSMPFLQKPYMPTALLEQVDAVLQDDDGARTPLKIHD